MKSLTSFYCNCCKITKLASEFVDKDKNGHPKQFRTCNNCRNKRRERLLVNNICDNEESLELIEIETLCQNLRELLNNCDSENTNLLAAQLRYRVDVSNFDDSAKKIANEIVELIEDIDEYNWM
jgi:hypothetical protein